MEYVESLESVEVRDSVDALDTIEGLESKMALDSVEVPDSVEVVPESVEVVPDSIEVVQCPRCGTFHAGGVFGEACFQAHRHARRFLHNMEKFDYEFFVLDVEKLQMDSDTILLPEHVIKKLEDAKMKQDAQKEQ
ncbi:unnamed protein product [Miscanthus lutarioriparius]|uniref:Uncharacterized protein n=1 Tax=Miscanthus lutarioriparius TaxID=422564 RepID=A0A811R673_9POAL|nr:unnamed protein product [Miscanthus lutarioriparius]